MEQEQIVVCLDDVDGFPHTLGHVAEHLWRTLGIWERFGIEVASMGCGSVDYTFKDKATAGKAIALAEAYFAFL